MDQTLTFVNGNGIIIGKKLEDVEKTLEDHTGKLNEIGDVLNAL